MFAYGIMSLTGATTPSITTLGILTFSKKKLSIKDLFVTLGVNDAHHIKQEA